MTEERKVDKPEETAPPKVIVQKRKRPTGVWLVPIVAALIGLWLGVRTILASGPSITITFQAAKGLEAGKTQIKFKDLVIGTVESITLAKDLSHVILQADMVSGTEMFMQLLRYGLGGVLLLPANLAVAALLHEVFGVIVEVAAACGFIVVLLVGFAMCRYVVFDAMGDNAARQFTAFAVSSVFFRGIEYAAFVALYRYADVQYVVSMVSVVGVSFIVKFAYYKRVVFAGTKGEERSILP